MEGKPKTTTAKVVLPLSMGTSHLVSSRVGWAGSVSIMLLCLWPIALRGSMFGEASFTRIVLKLSLSLLISARVGYCLFSCAHCRRGLRHLGHIMGAITAILISVTIIYPFTLRYTQFAALWTALVAASFSYLHVRNPSFFNGPNEG